MAPYSIDSGQASYWIGGGGVTDAVLLSYHDVFFTVGFSIWETPSMFSIRRIRTSTEYREFSECDTVTAELCLPWYHQVMPNLGKAMPRRPANLPRRSKSTWDCQDPGDLKRGSQWLPSGLMEYKEPPGLSCSSIYTPALTASPSSSHYGYY